MLLKKYCSLFKNLYGWCLGSAIVQFIILLVLFLLVSYLSTLLKLSDSNDPETVFASKYEKYVVLAISLFMIVPFAFSNLLIFGLFQEHILILTICIRASICNAVILFVLMTGSGIYSAIKGTGYVGYSLLVFGVFINLFLIHTILITIGVRENFIKGDDDTFRESRGDDISQNSQE